MSESPKEIVKAEINRIYDTFGRVEPQVVVNESEPDDAPLHGSFEWDDGVAGNAYRLHQARCVIRTVTIKRDSDVDNIPAFVKVEVDGRSFYEKTEVAVSKPDLWAQVMDETTAKMNGFKKRLKGLAEVEGDAARIETTRKVIRKIDQAIEIVDEARA